LELQFTEDIERCGIEGYILILTYTYYISYTSYIMMFYLQLDEYNMVEISNQSNLDKMTNEEAKIRFELACNDYIREPNKEAFEFVAENGHRFSILEFVQLLQ